MSRHAILIGNSVAYSDLEKSISAASLTRTLNRYKALLENLDESHRFEVSLQIDRPAEEIRQIVSKLGRQAARQDDLLLIHYFGHGTLSQDGDLLLVHPSEEPGEVDTLPIKSMETRIDESGVQKSIMLLDCCYSGAVGRSFQFTLRGEHCRIGSTVPTQKAYIEYKNLEAPIGFFTQAAMDALTDSAACISATDDRVTAQSLFDYITTALDQEALADLQKPTMAGRLQEAIWVYQEAPTIAKGFSSTANPKSAYAKIVAICKLMRSSSFVTIKELHKRLTHDPLTARSFKTLFKRPDETFVYIAVKIEVVARYVRLMERMDLLERGRDLRLTRLGRDLGAEWQERCNEILLLSIDRYLSEHGVTRQDLIEASRKVLQGRRVPSQQELADRLAVRRTRIPRSDIGAILDLLGYAGILQMSDSRAYFPWAIR